MRTIPATLPTIEGLKLPKVLKDVAMTKRGLVIFVGASKAFAIALVLAPVTWALPRIKVLATGGTAGTYYPFGGALAKIWNSKIKDMNVTAQTSGASGENVRLINKKEVELALVQSDTLDQAWNAMEAFKEPLKGMSVVATLYPEIVQVVVRADSPIKTFADLKGKRVSTGAPAVTSATRTRPLPGR